MCCNCVDLVEDAYHNFFICSKYESCRNTLFQAIQNIITSTDSQLLLKLLFYGSPNILYYTILQ